MTTQDKQNLIDTLCEYGGCINITDYDIVIKATDLLPMCITMRTPTPYIILPEIYGKINTQRRFSPTMWNLI
jgi:hypothetical protein